MTNRERIKAAIWGEPLDFIPAVFRLDLWYSWSKKSRTLPQEIDGMTLQEVEAFLGFGRSARRAKVFKTQLTGSIECVDTYEDDRIITHWHTAKGSLREVRVSTPEDRSAGISPTIVEYPIKTQQDYAIFQEVMQNTIFTEAYDDYRSYDAEIGESGLPLVVLGPIPFHDILVRWTGYETGFIHFLETPEVFLDAVEVANATYCRMWDIVGDSPAQLIMHGVNFDTAMTSPPIFREHFLPYIEAFSDKMHEKGKRVACHADGNMKGLLGLIVEAGYDVADCFACYPMVTCTLSEAVEVWGNKVTIWGGIPSTLLEPNTTIDVLNSHLTNVYNCIKSSERFIWGLADQAMPTSSWENIKHIAEWIEKHSGCQR